MLDTFIIDRIRRERERERQSGRVPLRIERSPPLPPEEPREEAPAGESRGSVVIDFRL